jgi:hypothetical protein
MPAKKNYDRRPNTHDSIGIETRFDDPDAPTGYRYEVSFPAVFRDEHLAFIKAYDVLFSDYLEPVDEFAPLLRYEHVGLYCDLYFAAERRERFNHDELARRRGVHPMTLRLMLDRLEDTRLCIRVKDKSGRGHPTHIVVCTPYSPKQLRGGGLRAVLDLRVKGKDTAKERETVGGRRFPAVAWDVKTLRRATKQENLARDLHAVQVKIEQLRRRRFERKEMLDDPIAEQTAFVAELKRLCKIDGLPTNQKIIDTALTLTFLKLTGDKAA